MWELLLLVLFGFLIGIIASMAGIGGGIFIVPILVFLYGFAPNPASATATSLTAIVFTAAASTVNYARQRRIYYKTGLALVITTAPGAYAGAWLAAIMDPKLLGLVFGAFLIMVAARTTISLVKKKSQDKPAIVRTDSEIIKTRKTILVGAGLSFFGGVASGLLGIGGGTLVVPIMAFAIGMPIHYATATSMFTMIFTSLSGVARYYQSNLINFPFALTIAAGTVFGAQVGAHTSRRLSGRNLSLLFSIILLVAGVNMIIKYL